MVYAIHIHSFSSIVSLPAEGSFDTKAEDVMKVTYVPSLVPFEKGILQSMQSMKITGDSS